MSATTNPRRLDLKRDEKLDIEWMDGRRTTLTIARLRLLCPCAMCKKTREGEAQQKKSLLRVLPGNWSEPIVATTAELIGNYALRIDWSDGHGSGIYSFDYLRSLDTDAG